MSTERSDASGRHRIRPEDAIAGGTTPAIGTTSTGALEGGTQPSVGELVRDASTHFSTLVRGEIELAKTEVTQEVKKAGLGVALFIVATVLLAFSLTFGLIALAEGLVTLGIWRWAAYLIVFGLLVLIAAGAAFIGYRKVSRIGKPERTITTVKETADWAKHPTQAPEAG